MYSKKFVIAIALAIGLGFVPCIMESVRYHSIDSVLATKNVPVVGWEVVNSKFTEILEIQKRTQTPEEYFTMLDKMAELKLLMSKHKVLSAWDIYPHGYYDFSRMEQQLLAIQQNIAFATNIDQEAKAKYANSRPPRVDPYAQTEFADTHAMYNLGLGWLWSMWIMFLVFISRARSMKHLVTEILSQRMTLAVTVWPFFVKDYMKTYEPESLIAMTKFATVQLGFLLSLVMGATIAKAQTGGTKQGSKAKSSWVVDMREGANLEGKGDPETLIYVGNTRGKYVIESITAFRKTSTTQYFIGGKEVYNHHGFKAIGYGGVQSVFNKGKPDTHRLLAGMRLSFAKKINAVHTAQVNLPLLHFERFVKPKAQNAFFVTGQVFDNIQNKWRVGMEFAFRKNAGIPQSWSAGPFIAKVINKFWRIEGLISFSPTQLARGRLRLVYSR